jgi:signal transduction histidine kinase
MVKFKLIQVIMWINLGYHFHGCLSRYINLFHYILLYIYIYTLSIAETFLRILTNALYLFILALKYSFLSPKCYSSK